MPAARFTPGHWTLTLLRNGAIIEAGPIGLAAAFTKRNLPPAQVGFALEDCTLTRESPKPSLFTCRRPEDFDGPELCDYGDTAVLRDHRGVCRFVGTRIEAAGTHDRGQEFQHYVFADALWRIQQKTFLQQWNAVINGAPASNSNSHLILAGTVAQNIQAILIYAVTCNDPVDLLIGNIDPPMKPPAIEVVAQKALQSIIDQLVWAPDAHLWLDFTTYDTAGAPTVHCRQSPAFTARTIDLLDRGTSGRKAVEVVGRIQALHHEQCPGVFIKYERVDTYNGAQRLHIFEDNYPPAGEPSADNALNLVINLIGFQRNVTSATLIADQIQTGHDATSLAWWKTVAGDLLNDRMANLRIVEGSFLRSLNKSNTSAGADDDDNDEDDDGLTPLELPNRLLPASGPVAPWMYQNNDPDDDPILWQRQWISIEMEADLYADAAAAAAAEGQTTPNDTKLVARRRKWRIPVQVIATDAPYGISDYSTIVDESQGEIPLAGLAQYLYNALNPVGHRGSLSITDVECEDLAAPGQKINLSNTARSEHATMAEPVQTVVEHIDTGRTDITFAPAPVLSVERIRELERANRFLRRWTSEITQEDGTFADGQQVELGQPNGHTNTQPGERLHAVFACWEADARVLLDAQQRLILIEKAGKKGYVNAQAADDTSSVRCNGGVGDNDRFAIQETNGINSGHRANGATGSYDLTTANLTNGVICQWRLARSCRATDGANIYAVWVPASPRFIVTDPTIIANLL